MKRSLLLEKRADVRFRGMLGFAMRAGKVLFGTELICAEMRRRPCRIRLVLLSASASEGTKKKITTKCEFYGLPLMDSGIPSEELGALLGKSFAPAVIAVCDDGFAKEIAAALDSRCESSNKQITERKLP